MTNVASGLSIALILTVLTVAGHTQDVVVLTTNYDIKFSVDDQVHRVKSRALVRSGNEIPILLQDFKVGLRVSDVSPDSFLVQMVVYERNESGWYQITVPPPEFNGRLGAPTEYDWKSGGMSVNLTIIVGLRAR